MDNNNLLMIILAFVFGYCLQGMMKNMCGGQIIEYSKPGCQADSDCGKGGVAQICVIKDGHGTCYDVQD